MKSIKEETIDQIYNLRNILHPNFLAIISGLCGLELTSPTLTYFNKTEEGDIYVNKAGDFYPSVRITMACAVHDCIDELERRSLAGPAICAYLHTLVNNIPKRFEIPKHELDDLINSIKNPNSENGY